MDMHARLFILSLVLVAFGMARGYCRLSDLRRHG